MNVLWKVRCFDRSKKALFDRELYLDTEALDGATKMQIESELRKANHQCVIPHRSLFQELDQTPVDEFVRDPTEWVAFTLPSYQEDEHGERITHIEVVRLATGDETALSIPPHVTEESLQRELAQLSPEEQKVYMQGLREMQEALKRDLEKFERKILGGPQLPIITLKTLIIPGDKTKEGILIRAVSDAWFELVRFLVQNPDALHEIDC